MQSIQLDRSLVSPQKVLPIYLFRFRLKGAKIRLETNALIAIDLLMLLFRAHLQVQINAGANQMPENPVQVDPTEFDSKLQHLLMLLDILVLITFD